MAEGQTDNLVSKIHIDFVNDEPSFLLCNSCGALLLKDYWICQKCRGYFCYKCGKDFQDFLKNLLPYCPCCRIQLIFKPKPSELKEVEPKKPSNNSIRETKPVLTDSSVLKSEQPLSCISEVKTQKNTVNRNELIFKRPVSDEEKIFRYLKMSRIKKFRNKKHLFARLSGIFRMEQDCVEKIWNNLERKYPVLIRQVTSELQDEVLRRIYDQLNYEAIYPKSKKKTDISSVFNEKTVSNKDEKVNLKDIKRIDGVEIVWKQGKMSAVEKINYRSKLDEN